MQTREQAQGQRTVTPVDPLETESEIHKCQNYALLLVHTSAFSCTLVPVWLPSELMQFLARSLLWANFLFITALAIIPVQARYTTRDSPTANTAWVGLHCHRTTPWILSRMLKMLHEECFIHWYHYKWSDFLLKLSPLVPWRCELFHVLYCCFVPSL